MKRWYEKIVFEAEGMKIEASKAPEGKAIITCSNACAHPPILEGYKHITGCWDTGFVIKRISDGSMFTWVPVEYLSANGTIDGEVYNEKFGRRNYRNDHFSHEGFHEDVTAELLAQRESIRKYGGFYISTYNISKNKITGAPQSVKIAIPWTKISLDEAKKIAESMEDRKGIKSHLVYGAEYDSVLEWFLKTEARTYEAVAEDSGEWGHYKVPSNYPDMAFVTGASRAWRTNNIFDFAGNVKEMTQEKYGSNLCTVRGGDFREISCGSPAARRSMIYINDGLQPIGFRVALYLE